MKRLCGACVWMQLYLQKMQYVTSLMVDKYES